MGYNNARSQKHETWELDPTIVWRAPTTRHSWVCTLRLERNRASLLLLTFQTLLGEARHGLWRQTSPCSDFSMGKSTESGGCSTSKLVISAWYSNTYCQIKPRITNLKYGFSCGMLGTNKGQSNYLQVDSIWKTYEKPVPAFGLKVPGLSTYTSRRMKYDATAPRFSGFLRQISMFLAVYWRFRKSSQTTKQRTSMLMRSWLPSDHMPRNVEVTHPAIVQGLCLKRNVMFDDFLPNAVPRIQNSMWLNQQSSLVTSI